MAAIDPNAPAAAPRKVVELLPTGPYLVSVKWAEKTLSNKGTPRVTFTYEVVAGDYKGKTHREDCYLTPGSLFKIQALAKAAGVKKAFDPDIPKDLIDTFVGKKVKIVLGADNWTSEAGEERETRKITVVESLDPEIKKIMDAERQARFPKTGAAGATGATSGASTGTDAAAGGEAEKEIPF